jgi:hypothetical protein
MSVCRLPRPRLRAIILAALLWTGHVAAAANAHHRVIVFAWDGMRPDAIGAEDTPNLLALAQRGVFFSDNRATYPSFTMANASSFATGAFPGPVGFYGNTFYAPGGQGPNARGAAADFQNPVYTEDYAVLRDLDALEHGALLQVPTLLATAQKAGLRTAVIGKSGPAFLQDYKRSNGGAGGVVLDLPTRPDRNGTAGVRFAGRLARGGCPGRRRRHPPTATACQSRTTPATAAMAPIARATRPPAGARRSAVIAAVTATIARRSITPMTSRIAVRLAQQPVQ